MMYKYLIGVLILFIPWFILYFLRKDLRKKMVFASLLAVPFGFTEIFYIQDYWFPKQTLFNLTARIGFDIESLLFCFAVGGIAAVLYEVYLNKHLKKARESRIKTKRHIYALVSVLLISFILLKFAVRLDTMNSSIIAMFLGAITIMITRKDLIKETLYGGILFLKSYFIMVLIINTIIFPGWIQDIWHIDTFLRITFLSVPLGEILWALAFGMLWAPIYEDIKGYKLK